MSSPRLQPKARRLEVEGKTIYVPTAQRPLDGAASEGVLKGFVALAFPAFDDP